MDEVLRATSTFEASKHALSVLYDGKISPEDETPAQMVERVVTTLVGVESKFNTPIEEQRQLAQQLGLLMDNKAIVFSTPIMTNAGLESHLPMSACTVPNVNLRGELSKVKEIVDQNHQEGMGTGFDLSDLDNPLEVLRYLNQVAIDGAKSGTEARPVGNMATLRIDHPRVIDFIRVKADNPGAWKFNLSVDTPEEFWSTVKQDGDWVLSDGQRFKARDILHLIAKTVHSSAEPGIISMDRLNADNPVPALGLYKSAAPCAEVGLTPGETCQFGYINLSKFIGLDGKIDFEALSITATAVVRALDNALEVSIGRYSAPDSAAIMMAKRKIGVGVCGLADMLVEMGIPYDSEEGRQIAKDVVAHINFISKKASHELAKKRGSFTAMAEVGSRYLDEESYLSKKYGGLTTQTVSSSSWTKLAETIKETKQLRNSSTIALPPTGRSALVIDASTGVEPYFSLKSNPIALEVLARYLENYGYVPKPLIEQVEKSGTCQHLDIPDSIKRIFKTASEISAMDHLLMVDALIQVVDESISKTINLSSSVTTEEIYDLAVFAMSDLSLKGITFYRDGSLNHQPIELKQK
jgi:ribonucleoside-diphosphate reductase alpha chain